jgi:hypothetical protein
MNERAIQNQLWRQMRSSCKISAPNFTPHGWFECDLFSVYKSGYWAEHEIKLTVADFKKDAEKENLYRIDGVFQSVKKHDMLTARNEQGPSYFWYVLSTDVARQVEVPEWAGLMVVSCPSKWLNLNVMKKAPRLHKIKVSDAKLDQVKMSMYWRYWRLRLHKENPLEELEDDHG